MKRLVCAIIIIAVSFAASLLGYGYVNTSLDEIIYIAKNEPSELDAIWNEKRTVLSILLKNSDIDSIEEQIYSDYSIDELTAIINSIKDGEQFNIGNVF